MKTNREVKAASALRLKFGYPGLTEAEASKIVSDQKAAREAEERTYQASAQKRAEIPTKLPKTWKEVVLQREPFRHVSAIHWMAKLPTD